MCDNKCIRIDQFCDNKFHCEDESDENVANCLNYISPQNDIDLCTLYEESMKFYSSFLYRQCIIAYSSLGELLTKTQMIHYETNDCKEIHFHFKNNFKFKNTFTFSNIFL